MFKRKIFNEFDKWQTYCKLVKKKALLVTGARQVGKTTAILEYAKTHYKSYLYLDFYNDRNLLKIFDEDYDINRILSSITRLAQYSNIKLYGGQSVIIFDEIQECSKARMSLKYFSLDGRYDCIASGSLLGIKGYNENFEGGTPIGFEYLVHLRSLDFEEFLLAMEYVNEDTLSYLKNCFENKKRIDETLHLKMLDYFKEYMLIGGLPEAITAFKKTHLIAFSNETLNSIVEEYKFDFGKHLNKKEESYINSNELNKTLLTFNSIPSQLAKENKKFNFSEINKNARKRDFDASVKWLEDAGLINLCYNLKKLSLPLSLNVDDSSFKIYFDDPGIMSISLNKDLKSMLLNETLGEKKGVLYENTVSSMLIRNNVPLYHYYNDSGLEVDFIIEYLNKVTLVEVKARNGNAKASRYILNNYDKYHCDSLIKLTSSNIAFVNNIFTIPYYLTYLIK